MKAASISQLKKELKERSHPELVDFCLRMAKFKKESKELLSYILYESDNEDDYVATVKETIDDMFEKFNYKSIYLITKSTRKALRETKKFIRYSKVKETEVRLLLYFCEKLKEIEVVNYDAKAVHCSVTLNNIYSREIIAIRKKILVLEDDLQYDYGEQLKEILRIL